MAKTKKPRTQKVRLNPIYSVHDPNTSNYFLLTQNDIKSAIVSKSTGKAIPDDELIIQYMPQENMITWSRDYIKKITSVVKKAESEIEKDSFFGGGNNMVIIEPSTMLKIQKKNSELVEETLSKSLWIKKELEKQNYDFNKKTPVLSDLIGMESVQYVSQYQSTAFLSHTIGHDLVNNRLLVFQVGQGGGIIFNVLLADITSDDVKDALKKAALAAGILLKVVSIIGVLMGVKTQSQKSAEAIQEALKKKPVMEAILKFIDAVRNGAKDIASLFASLIRALYDADVLGMIISAALAGAFTIVGIIWLLASLLSKLIPGIGWAVTAAQLVVLCAGLVTEIMAF